MSWITANLGGLGKMGDKALADTCVPWPTDINPQRVICGGITFAQRAYALSWPGAAMIEDYPTVHSVAQGQELFTPMFFGAKSRETPLDTQMPVGPAASATEAALTGRNMGPVTLVAPLPSITPLRDPQVVGSDQLGFVCHVNSWVARNPLLALAGLFGVYALVKGGRR